MARILVLLGIPEDGRPPFRIDQLSSLGPLPAPISASMRRVQTDEGFWDDVGVLTKYELRQWHEESRARAFQPPYDSADWRPYIEQSLQKLDQLLASADCPSLFLVLNEEFESGMG